MPLQQTKCAFCLPQGLFCGNRFLCAERSAVPPSEAARRFVQKQVYFALRNSSKSLFIKYQKCLTGILARAIIATKVGTLALFSPFSGESLQIKDEHYSEYTCKTKQKGLFSEFVEQIGYFVERFGWFWHFCMRIHVPAVEKARFFCLPSFAADLE